MLVGGDCALDTARIVELLAPYMGAYELTPAQLHNVSTYVDILHKWNQRTNLTAIRTPDEMVERHFGESLFAAIQLLAGDDRRTVIDVGSGAGFPGLPLKIYSPGIRLTLIESQNKKATFLREAIRAMGLSGVEVYANRAEQFPAKADLVTMRAVERFQVILPIAGSLVAEGGSLGFFVGSAQLPTAKEILPGNWLDPVAIPNSQGRILAIRRSD